MMTKRDWLGVVIDAMGGALKHHPDLDVVERAMNKLTARELAAVERLIADGRHATQEQATRSLRKAAK